MKPSERVGPLSANWKGGRSYAGNGYMRLRINKRYVYEHRYLMEQKLGRKLLHREHVHHINGIKDDNRLNNLIVLSEREHHLHHKPYQFLPRPCKQCKKIIEHPRRDTIVCSIKCRTESKKHTVNLTCETCQKSYSRPWWIAFASRQKHHFCSIDCRDKRGRFTY